MKRGLDLQRSAGYPGSSVPAIKQPGKADVVISLNGRDEGKRFLIIGTEDDYSLLADGKSRKVETPKRKKNKHLRYEGNAGGPMAAKLASGDKVTNNEIRRALAQYTADRGEKEGGM